MSTRVTIKGQVTIPRHVRQTAGIKPGDEVEFVVEPTGKVLLQHADRRVRLQRALERIRRDPPIKTLSSDEIMAMTRGEGR